MTARVGLRDRIRYRVDCLLSKGSASAVGWVVVLAVLLAVLGGLTFWLAGVGFGDRSGLVESFYQAFLIAIGKGGIVDADWTSRAVSFVFVFAGVFLTGSLIGVLVAAVTRRLDELRRGLGRVLETDHTVVLGWSPRLLPVVRELLLEDPTTSVVVLADRDKQAMEDEFRSTATPTERDRVAFRSGDPSRRSDLERVAVDSARAVIVLSHGSFVDAAAVRRALIAHRVQPEDAHVVTELTNPRVARSLSTTTHGHVGVLTVGDVVSDVLAQSVRRSGLGQVFADLLSFGGSELHLVDSGAMAGQSFHSVAAAPLPFAVLGWVQPDQDPVILPPPTALVPADCRLVVVAQERPVGVALGVGTRPTADVIVADLGVSSVLVLGWNPVGEGLLDRLDEHLEPTSRVTVMADSEILPGGLPTWRWRLAGNAIHTKHDPEEVLHAIRAAAADVVVVLGYTDRMTTDEADAMTMLSLAMLERSRVAGRLTGTRLVAQLHDHSTAEMVREQCSGDFVVTDAFVSRVLVHASRDRAMPPIHRELFDAAGPVLDVVRVGEVHPWDDVRSAVADFGMVALGIVRDGRTVLGPDVGGAVGPADGLVVARRPNMGEVDVVVEVAVPTSTSGD